MRTNHRGSALGRILLAIVLVLGAAASLVTTDAATAPAADAADATPVHTKVSFQTAGTPAPPTGFTKDTGAAYTEAAGQGFVTQASLSEATHTPIDASLNTRDRSACTATGWTVANRSMIHLQYPSTANASTGIATPVAWEKAVPNGRYQVTVGVGDPNLGNDNESHTVRVEGQPAVSGFARSTAANCTLSRVTTGTAVATVTDGRLTVDAIGGTNTKLQYVTIDSLSPAVAGLTATAQENGIALGWSAADGATAGYRVYRSANSPVATTGTALATLPAGTTGYTDTTAVRGSVYFYAVVYTDAAGLVSDRAEAGAVIDDAQPTLPPMPVRVNFAADLASPAIAGYTNDNGRNFANLRGYGWVVPGSQTPLSLVGNGRARTEAGLDDRLRTMIHMQADDVPAPAAGTIKQEGAWELAVADGSYDVELAVGDATPGTDPTRHTVNVEGRKAVDGFETVTAAGAAATGAARFKNATLTGVQVSDGRLTIDAVGGTNTKLDYVTVTPTPQDPAPAAPSNLRSAAGDGSVVLDWDDAAEDDLAGYRVYRSTSETVPVTGTPVSGTDLLTSSAFTDTTAQNDTTYRYAVVAVDRAGNASAASSPTTATPDAGNPTQATLPLKVAFQSQTSTELPQGYTRDHGVAWSNTRGLGWVDAATGRPLSLVGNGRLRDVRAGFDVPLRQRGLMHMQLPRTVTSGVYTPGSYEVAVPDATYDVTVGVGDQPGSGSVYDSVHQLTVEGKPAITAFQATAAKEFDTASVKVKVTDGRLTIDPTGGTNTKINFVTIDFADVTAPARPAGLEAEAADGSVALTWDSVTDGDLAGYRVYRSTGDTVETTAANRLGDALLTTAAFTDRSVTNGTAYRYAVTSVDREGNESDASTSVAATPKDATAPAAPQNLSAVVDAQDVTLRWTAGTETDLEEYRLYRSTSADVELDADHLVTTGSATSHTDEDLEIGTEYHWVVVAVDRAGNVSPASAPATATPTAKPDTEAPAAPARPGALPGDHEVRLSWAAGSEADLAGYHVYRSATAGGARTRLTTLPLGSPSYTDADAANGTRYHYVVTAVDLAGNESEPSDEVDATPADDRAPAVPAGVTATAGVQSVTVTWTRSAEPDLRGYRIYRSADGAARKDPAQQVGAIFGTGRTFVDVDLEPGRELSYVVTSVDQVGNESDASTAVAATPRSAPDTTAPSAPAGLRAEVVDGKVDLRWDAVTANDLAGYLVFRSTTATGERVQLTAAPQTGRTFTDASAAPGQPVFYEVRAVDTSNNQSAASTQVSTTVPAQGLVERYDFVPTGGTVPNGYTAETGLAWTDARGHGWVREDSLTSATHTPLDLSANTRDRARTGIDARLNSIIHLQYGTVTPTPTANGDLTSGAWERALPNGRYEVQVAVGDQPGGAKTGCAAPCYDSTHTVRVEGATAIDRFQATAATEFRTATVTVDVTDGRLTLDAVGGTNTKLAYVTIEGRGAATPDTTAPSAPGAVTALPGDRSVTVSWTAPAESDVAGYRVYRATGDTVAVTPANRLRDDLVTARDLTDRDLTNGTRYAYVVTAVDRSGNESVASAVRTATPTAAAGALVQTRVDFQDAASTPASGYVADWGQAYGPRTDAQQGSGLTYGWVDAATGAAKSFVGNGRNRTGVTGTTGTDPRLLSFMHFNAPANATSGVPGVGTWEMAVPNGAYTVTVAVGDAGTALDSTHWVNVENQNAIAEFVPSTATRHATATRTVVVSDGRLTLTQLSGTNTKIDYVDVSGVDTQGRPYPIAVQPPNLETGVVTNASVTADNNLNEDTGAVDETTLGGGNVSLVRVSDGTAVPGTGVTSGGGDTVSFQAATALAPGTLYRFSITAGAKDKSGRAFLPFSSVFTTKATGGQQPGTSINAAFDKSDSGATKGNMYTSVVVGPDGKLYAGSILGNIYRWTIKPDGTLGDEEVIDTVQRHATAKGWEGAPNRTVIGLAFDPASTATNPILWISDNYAYLGSDVPDATGAIARLSGPRLQNYDEIVVNLPRSLKDHETNSIAWKNGKLYINQGSMNAMGANDGTWRRDEHLLSAALLELDPAKLPASLPLDAATADVNAPARNGVPAHRGTYDPYAAGAPLTLYATGIRNAYDLVWHSNGHLYTGVNGSAAGGNTPATPATLPAACGKRPDGGYTGPSVPAITNNRQAETDYIFDVQKNKYYGHPNPLRCEWILNAGNPNGYAGNPAFKTNAYPAGTTSDPNYDLEHVYDAGLHASANGTIEYKNTGAFGGALAGKLVVVRYSANQEVVVFDPKDGSSVSQAVVGLPGFTGFKQPLDVAEDTDSGNLYVTELTDNPATTRIVLLKPQGGTGTPVGRASSTERHVFTEVAGGAASAARTVTVKNTGNGPLTVSSAAVTGADASLFTLSGTSTLPATVPAGGSLDLPVTFDPAVPGPRGATLTVTTDDPRAATLRTTLRGLGTRGTGGSNEPSLQWILDTLQIPVDVGDSDKTDNDMSRTSDAIGDEVKIPSFTKAAFDRVVTVETLSLFGPAGGSGNVVTVGAHTSGNPSERTPLVRGPNGQNQLVLPQMTQLGEYDNETTAFGFDFTWHGLSDRVTYSEDGLNTWDAQNPHKVRVYPYKNADGTVEPNAYLVAPEDVPSPVDYQDAVILVRNVKPAATAGAGKLTLSSDELVFSGVRGTTSSPQKVTVTNTGSSPLAVTGAALAGSDAALFELVGGPTTLAAGGSTDYVVRLKAPGGTTAGSKSARLSLTTDDTTKPSADIGLHALVTTGLQGGNEPPLKQVVDTLGRPIDVGGTGLILNPGSPLTASPIGSEVLAPLFQKAGTAPIRIKPVARYSPDELLPFGWYEPNSGDPVLHETATIALGQEQTLNPSIVAGGASTFDPGTGRFGLYVDSRSFNRKSYTQDGLNTGDAKHAARTYPALDRAGRPIADTYLVGFEDAANGDYQDYVFEVSGVKPVSPSGTTPVAKIDFTTANGGLETGYTRDSGGAYTQDRGFGWVRPGTSTPIDMTAQTRERDAGGDQRLRTLTLMQPTAAQSPDGPGAWEHALPNGAYKVTLSVGDPSFTDSTHRITVEGQTALAGFTPTDAEKSRTVTASVQVTDGRLTIDATGGTNTKIQYVDVDAVTSATDTVAPTVSTRVTGLQSSAGRYRGKATVEVVASDAGSGVAGTSYSLDGGAFVPYTAPVVVDRLGEHTVRSRAQDAAGNVATSTTTTFTVVEDARSRAEVVVDNLDGVPFDDRLVMNRIQTPETGRRCVTTGCDPLVGPFVPANVVHDVSTLRIRNTGTDTLNVTGLDLTGPFQLVTPVALPATVPAGGSLEVPVRFTATSIGTAGGLWTGSLAVATDDADEPVTPVELAGFWQSVSEGGQEPDVAEISRLFGYRTAITNGGTPLNQQGLVNASGDEVLSPYWLRADSSQPVSVRQLGAFHTQGNTASFFWHAKGSNTTPTVVTHAGVEGQSILPHRNGSTTAPASGTFTPTGAFGMKIDPEWSDPTKNSQTADVAAGCAGPCGHHLRTWPARDRSGAILPNTWLVAMDYSGINYDYNDNVYLVTNMRPELAADPAANAPLPGAAKLRLDFDRDRAGTLTDADGRTTGFVSTQRNRLDGATGASSYDRSRLKVDTTARGTLAITSRGTADAGTNGAADNTLVNGLQIPFDGTDGQFSVTGRVLGSLASLDAGSEQQGVMLGTGQDDYVKVVAINKGGVPSLELYGELGGTGTTQGATVPIPSPGSVGSLDLALVAQPKAGTVRAAYRVDDGTWTFLPGTFAVPAASAGKLFDRQSQAGVIVSHKGGAELVATYDSFAVTDGDVTVTSTPERSALYRLDVAGSGPYTDTRGRTWTTDAGRFTPTTAPVEGASATAEIAGTDDDVLYRTYRGNVGNVPQAERVISYALPSKGATKVDLRLHFAERASGNDAVGRRVFDVEAEGRTLRKGFDVFAAAGATNTATVLPLNGVAVTDGVLNLTFRATVDHPAIAAIEVLCDGTCPVDTTAPAAVTGLTGTAGANGVALDWADSREDDVVGYLVTRTVAGVETSLTGAPVSASQLTDTTAPAGVQATYSVVAVDSSDNRSPAASTTVTTQAQQAVRINAGGPAQTVGSTTWSACTATTACANRVNGGGFAYGEADTITGVPAGLNQTIFQTEWTGGASGGTPVAVGQKAFGFTVPVTNGRYTVRLHFAELNKTGAGQRTFDVRLEDSTVLSGFDIWQAAGGIDRVVTRSFPVTVADGNVSLDFIRRVENAKVSAIEIVPFVPDTTAPTAPTAVTANGSATGVALGWTASTADDVAGYHVYRSTTAAGPFTRLTTSAIAATAYADSTAPQGVTSYYRVTALDTSGNESTPATGSARRPDTTAPGAPTAVTATGSTGGVAVGWTASSADDVAGYHVYRSATAGGSFTRITTSPVTGTAFSDANAPQGTSYYRVTAVDTSGNESTPSGTASGARPDTTPPPVVTGVGAAGSATGVRVTWTASGAGDLAGYHVYRAATATGSFTRLTTGTVTGTGYTDATAPQGTSYYRVTAVDTAGNESAASATASGTRPDTTAPDAVTGVTATGSATGVQVGWAASTAGDLAGYHVYRAATATGSFTRLTTGTITARTFADTGAPTGASYYRVTAVDTAGNESTPSATATGTRPAPAGQQPVRINAGGPAQTVGSTTWTACATTATCANRVTGGFPYAENDTITGVPSGLNQAIFQTEWTGGATGAGQVAVGQRAFGFAIPVSNGKYTVKLHFAELNKTGAGQRTFDVRLENTTVLSGFDIWQAAGGIDRVVTRSFPVTVSDGSVSLDFLRRVENAKISAIEVVPFTADSTAPGAPTALTATGSTGGVTLGWAPSTADDLAGFHVYRSTGGGAFTRLTSAPVDTRTYADASAPVGASSYRITAVDTNGNESGPSGTVTATRPAPARPTVRINAGGAAQTVSGTTWAACSALTACSGRVTGGFAHTENDTITGVPAGMNQTLFRSEWTGGASGPGVVPVGQRAFGFAVPVTNGRYTVRLHFAELNKTAVGQRVFDVRLEGATVLNRFDVFQAAGGIDRVVTRSFPVTVTDGAVSLDFIRRVENAKVSAIEIVPLD